MSTIDYAPLPAVSPSPRRSMTAIIVGATLVVIGFLTGASGGVLLALFGSDTAIGSGQHPVSTPTSALITDLGAISDTNQLGLFDTHPTLHLSATGSTRTPVFIGIGPSDQVDRYLTGVQTDRVTDFDLSPYFLDTTRQNGDTVAASPVEQDFWVAAAQSTANAELSWQFQDGRYDVVIMNADGSAQVASLVEVGVSLPDSTALWLAVIFIGVGFLAVGAIVIGVGAIRR